MRETHEQVGVREGNLREVVCQFVFGIFVGIFLLELFWNYCLLNTFVFSHEQVVVRESNPREVVCQILSGFVQPNIFTLS